MTSEQANLFQSTDEKPKTATDYLTDLLRYKESKMTKTELRERWKGHRWSSDELRAWAAWQWKDVVK